MNDIPKKRVYIFDTSAFSALHRQHMQVIEMPQAIWDAIEKMLKDGQIISHEYVYDEAVNDKAENPDYLTEFLMPYKSKFEHASEEQYLIVGKVVEGSPKLIDPRREKEQADPWIIAQAVIHNQQMGLLEDCEYVIVTQENKRSPKKIPLAASRFDIDCISLREFFEENGIRIIAALE